MTGLYSRTGLALLGAALYGGPLLAGLAGHDWSVVPVLAALFLLYVAASRKPDLETGAGRAGLVMMAAAQVVLVAIAWGAGLAAAALFGGYVLPLWAPIAITATAAGIGVLAMRDAAEMDVMLDSALARLAEFETGHTEGLTPETAWPDPSPETEASVRRALTALRELGRIDRSRVEAILRALLAETGALGFDPLYDAAGRDGAENEPVVDYALLRFAALPEVFDRLSARGEAGLAPMLLLRAPDAQVRAEARARIAHMVDARLPSVLLPDPSWLKELAREFPGEGYEDLLPRRRLSDAQIADA